MKQIIFLVTLLIGLVLFMTSFVKAVEISCDAGCDVECDEDEDCPCPSDKCSDSSFIDYPDHGICLDCKCDVCTGCGGPCEPITIDCSKKDSETGYCKCECGPYVSTNGEDDVDCDDGIDNDCDGMTDLDDTDCISTTTTITTTSTTTTRIGGRGRTVWIIENVTTTILEPECGNGECEEEETCSNCPEDCGLCPKVNITVVNLIYPDNVTADESFILQVVIKNVGNKEGFDDVTISVPINWSSSVLGQRVTLKKDSAKTLYFTLTPSEDSGEIAAGTSTGFLVSDTIHPLKLKGPDGLGITGLAALLTSLSYWWLGLIIIIMLILIYLVRRKPSRKVPYKHKPKKK